MDIKEGWKKFWHLLWKDNSWKGWIFSLVFLLVFFKLIFFPGLSLITGSSLPLAIVESCSMYHENNMFSNYDKWWNEHEQKYSKYNLTKQEFEDFSFYKGFSKGDILLIVEANPEKLKVGDIIIFQSGTGTPVIHRIINIENKDGEYFFDTIGDNNNEILTPSNNAGGVDERNIKEEQLVGKAVFRVAPYLGWMKLIFYEHLRPEYEKGLCHEN
ncbi:MAG: signal peptidase I [Nanoarchaeota archaeon]|nr:signal peptidase I [Nanoarchaeota archaeon]